MKHIKHIFIGILIPLFAFSQALGEDSASGYLKSHVVTKKLSNGITLVMLNRGFAPTLYLEIAFKVASADESYRTMGAAHLLEHMLFKGTDTVGTKDFKQEEPILRRIEAVGETIDALKLKNPRNENIPKLEEELRALQEEHQKFVVSAPYDTLYTEHGAVGFNASTSKDMTNYYISLPASELELWAKTEAERLRKPIMREYYQERSNVVQERMMRTDSIGTGLLYEAFLAQAFFAHPYRHPVIGWGTNIPYLSVKDVRSFYYSNYVPSRMTITIVGRQNTDETFSIVEKYFSYIEPVPEPPEINVSEPMQRGERRVEINFASNPALLIGWHKPTYPAKEDFVFDVFAEVAAGGRSSALYKSLVIEKKKAYSISAWNGMPGARYDNMFVISATPANGVSHQELEADIYAELATAADSVSSKDLETVKMRMEASSLEGLTTNSGIGRMLSYSQTVFGDWRYVMNYVSAIADVTAADIKQAFHTYCVDTNRVVGFLKDSRVNGQKDGDK